MEIEADPEGAQLLSSLSTFIDTKSADQLIEDMGRQIEEQQLTKIAAFLKALLPKLTALGFSESDARRGAVCSILFHLFADGTLFDDVSYGYCTVYDCGK